MCVYARLQCLGNEFLGGGAVDDLRNAAGCFVQNARKVVGVVRVEGPLLRPVAGQSRVVT